MSGTPQKTKLQTAPPAPPEDSLLAFLHTYGKKDGSTGEQGSDLFQKKDQFPTGIDSVDTALNGGVNGITILAGRPGVGKTAFMSQVAVKAVQNRDDTAVLIYSLDMSPKEFFERLLIAATAEPQPQIEVVTQGEILGTLSNRQMSRIFVRSSLSNDITRELTRDEKRKYLYKRQLVVGTFTYRENQLDWVGPGNERTLNNTAFPRVQSISPFFNGSAMEAMGKKIAQGKNVRNLLVMVDLFQDIRCDDNVGNRRDDQILEHLKENESKLQQLFPKGEVSFLISSAVRKESNSQDKRNNEFRMDDVIGSTNLSYSTDVLLGLNFRKKVCDGENTVVLDVLKGRDGVTRGPIELRYQYKTGQFSSKSQPASQQEKKPAKRRRKDLRT